MDTRSQDVVAAELFAAYERKDATAVAAPLEPAFAIVQPELLPWSRGYDGIEGFGRFVARLCGAVDSHVDVEEYAEFGANVLATGRTADTVRASQAASDVRIRHVRTVRDCRATGFEAFVDTPAMLAALARTGA
jgi:ketosteroid isomerase-like protein